MEDEEIHEEVDEEVDEDEEEEEKNSYCYERTEVNTLEAYIEAVERGCVNIVVSPALLPQAKGYANLHQSESGYWGCQNVLLNLNEEDTYEMANEWLLAYIQETKDPEATTILAHRCYLGKGTEEDVSTAVALWQVAIGEGYAPAMRDYALMILYGEHQPEEAEEGVEAAMNSPEFLLFLAASMKDTESELRIAELYLEGKCQVVSKDDALRHCMHAVEKRFPGAKDVLKNLL